jgi:uncharacterized protein YidB (DUF937 family)
MTALLGLLAVAGYQNRDKIAEWLNAAQRKAGTLAQTSDASAASGLPANLSGILAGTSLGDLLSGGLRDLVTTFKHAGQGEAADSWVAPARINRSAVLSWNRRSGRRCWKPCLDRPDCLEKR